MYTSERQSSRVFIRQPIASDLKELLSLHQRSQSFHAPWVYPSLTEDGCKKYIQRCQQDTFEGLLICHRQNHQIIGVANLSQIFYSAFQNAYLGYYIDVDYAKQGLMKEGLILVINHAFFTLKLHRIEANIQPKNLASIYLVNCLGFRQEGYSPRYLKINDTWRDHERWALTVEDWTAANTSQLRIDPPNPP